MTVTKLILSLWVRSGLLGRLLVPVGITLLIGFGIQGYLTLNTAIVEQRQHHQNQLDELVEVLSQAIAEQVILGDYATINQHLSSQVKKRQDIQQILWSDGEGGMLTANATVQEARAPAWFMRVVDIPQLKLDYDIELAGTSYGKLSITITTIPAGNKLWYLFLQQSLYVLVVMFTVFSLITLILRTNLKALRDLSSAADQFRRGNHSVRIKPEGASELRTAVEAFNNMADGSETLLAELTSSKQQLREQLNFNMELFDAVAIPVFYKDRDGRYLGVNRAWENFFGQSEADIIGKTLSEIYPQNSDIARQHYEADQQLLKDLSEQSYEVVLPGLPGGDRHVLFSKATYRDTEGDVRGIIGAITDLTKARQAEQKAQAALLDKHAAEAASQSKSSFLANMSHEIRTPLTAIIGFSESLLDNHLSTRDRTHNIETIIRSGKHLLRIINDILDLSKIEANKLEIELNNFSIIDVLNDVQALTEIQASNKQLDFSIDYQWPLPARIQSDPLRLKQILINLCCNAIKFTQTGDVRLVVSHNVDSGKLRFDIIDTGIGMTTEQLKNLFNAFSQADATTTRKYGGTGLGLYLSRQLANYLGGDISVTSTPGEGSCFSLYIATGDLEGVPLLEQIPETEKVQHAAQDNGATPALHGKILLAEDNSDNQRLISLHLNKLGTEVTIVKNGEEAVRQAMTDKFDLVLMDMQMPIMDGLEATSTLRSQQYSGPIVALTANAMQEDVSKCLAAGCDDFLAKPIERERFIAVISNYLQNTNEQNTTIPLTSQLLEDDPEMVELVVIYSTKLPVKLQEIEQAYTQQDWSQLKALLHDLKGVSGSYGFPQMSELAARMESDVKNNKYDDLAIFLAELNAMAKRIQAGTDNTKAATGNAA